MISNCFCIIFYILKVFNLDVIAQTESAELSINLGGAELSNGFSHITAGIKIMDRRAIDPLTEIPLSTVDDETFGRFLFLKSESQLLLNFEVFTRKGL
jgi:hypothetical protein